MPKASKVSFEKNFNRTRLSVSSSTNPITWHQYSPRLTITRTSNKNSNPISIIELVNSPIRHYIAPRDTSDRYDSKYTNMETSQRESLLSGNNRVGVLDMGTASLQRIIDQMHGLNVTDDVYIPYDPLAARQAGYPRYGEYLIGKKIPNTANDKAHIKRILSN